MEANQLFLDKVLEVSGKVENVLWAKEDAIVLLGVEPLGGISCRFSPGTIVKERNIKYGTEVVIKGRCSGYNIDVNLVDCQLR